MVVKLPPGISLSPRVFATLTLRIKLDLLKPALHHLFLDDLDYDDPQGLDVDTMELLCLELGFTTERLSNDKVARLERAEGRCG